MFNPGYAGSAPRAPRCSGPRGCGITCASSSGPVNHPGLIKVEARAGYLSGAGFKSCAGERGEAGGSSAHLRSGRLLQRRHLGLQEAICLPEADRSSFLLHLLLARK